MGLLAILGFLLVITKSSLEISSDYFENDHGYRLINNMRIHKREAKPSRRKNDDSFNKDFIEEKLVAHGQALEHLVTMVQKNEELTRKLVEKLSAIKTIEEPDMPEKVELSGRRSFGQVDTPEIRGETGNLWCIAAFLCRSDNVKVCGFDSSYGYGRFKDICHMFDVNCYWKYNFVLSHACDQLF